MDLSVFRSAAVAVVCNLALAGSAVPAVAASVPGIRPVTDLTLALHDGESAAGPVLAEVTLMCDPAGGTHPHAAAACESLNKVDGNFAELPPVAEVACTDIFAPVTAEAKGEYRGEPVRFVHTYSNRCEAQRSTDDVSAF
jgi:hypothetical protein